MSLSSRFRRRLWRTAYALSGGLTVTGRWPPGKRGRILVANHTSHGDTAAVLAALPSDAYPVFAAAADYWFDVPVRRALVTGLAGALPVRRGESGGYEALRAAAEPALAAGRTVVVYPEGTRTQDGSIGRFHSGAIRLARDTGVPLVPVAILGTGDLLPKHGRFTAAPVEVRIGAPVSANQLAPEDLRDHVVALHESGPAARRSSRVWRAAARLADQGVRGAGGPDRDRPTVVGWLRGARARSPDPGDRTRPDRACQAASPLAASALRDVPRRGRPRLRGRHLAGRRRVGLTRVRR